MQPLGLHSPLGRSTPLGDAHQMMRLRTPLGQFTSSVDPSSSAPKPFQTLGQILQASFLERSLPYQNIATTPPTASESAVAAQFIDFPFVDQPSNFEFTESQGNPAIANLEPLVQPKSLPTQKPLAQTADFLISPFTEVSDYSDPASSSQSTADPGAQETTIPERIETQVQTQIQTQFEAFSATEQSSSFTTSSTPSPAPPSQLSDLSPGTIPTVDAIADPALSVSKEDPSEPDQLPNEAGIQTNLEIQTQIQEQTASATVPTQPSSESEPTNIDSNINSEESLSQPYSTAPPQLDSVTTTDKFLTPPTSPPPALQTASLSLTSSTPPAEPQAALPLPLTQPPIPQQTESISVTESSDMDSLQLQPLEPSAQTPIPTESSSPVHQLQAQPLGQLIEPIHQVGELFGQEAATNQPNPLETEQAQAQDTIPLSQEAQPLTAKQSEMPIVAQAEPPPIQQQIEPATEALEAEPSTQQPALNPQLNNREAIAPTASIPVSETEARKNLPATDPLPPQIELKSANQPQAATEYPTESGASAVVEHPSSEASTSIEPAVSNIDQTQQTIQAKLEPATSQEQPPITSSIATSTDIHKNAPDTIAPDTIEQSRDQIRLDIPQLPQHPPLGLQKPLAATPDLLRTILPDQKLRSPPIESSQSATTSSLSVPNELTETPAAKRDTPMTWSSVAELLGESSTTNRRPESWQEQFNLQTPVTEELISPRLEQTSQPPTIGGNAAQEYTLTSPLANLDTQLPDQIVGLQDKSTLINEEQMELLAQTVYRLMRDRFILNQERSLHVVASHSHWLDVFSYHNFQSTAPSNSTSSAPNQQLVLDNYPPDRQLQTLVQEVYQLTQLRLEQDRERLSYF